MKIPLSWLREYLDFNCTIEELTHRMTMIGIEVEGVEDPAKALKGFVVGHVIACAKHPDADKLNVTTVDTGTEKLQVVCGAPNCRLGLKGVFAPSGSYIPGLDVTLKKASIRGQESNGMLCSERELLLSDEHKGIIELPDSAVTGSSAAEALGLNDPVIDISITPNRGDHAGIYGVARDLAAAGLGTLKPLKTEHVKGSYANPVKVDLQTPACPLFIGRHIRGVTNGPSPKWLQDRLKAAGLRPISALVDVTNYFAIGLCRPLHVFDARKLDGHIHVRAARAGEELAALNDKTYALQEGMTAVCDDSGVLGLGGIIGGTGTGCDEETTDVYLECALFDPSAIARAGRALMVNSDARYRFERGVDPDFALDAAHMATQMILDLCGGEASELYVAGKAPDNRRTIMFDPAYTAKLGGVEVTRARQVDILEKLGFTVGHNGEILNLVTPTWRPDVEGRADIVEEVLRIHGFEHIEAKRPAADSFVQKILPLRVVRATSLRAMLAARGMLECITWAFMDSRTAAHFGANDNQQAASLTLKNPISSELDFMRPSIVPNLLEAAIRNADRGFGDAALFEIGNVYRDTTVKGHVLTATGLRRGNAAPRHWALGAARAVDAYDAKADALAVLEQCGFSPESAQVTRDAPAYYHPGRSGTLRLGANVLGYFGELHPRVLEEMKCGAPASAFEIFIDAVPAAKNKSPAKKLLKLSALQPVRRDFAFVADEGLEVEKLTRAITAVDKALITEVSIFDVYQGKGVEPGKKSVALAVTLQPVDKTLTDEEINALSAKIIDAASKAGGSLRA